MADDLALVLHDRHPRVVSLSPVVAAVDVAHLDIEAATHEWQQRLDEDIAEVALDALAMIEGLLELEDPDAEDDDEYL